MRQIVNRKIGMLASGLITAGLITYGFAGYEPSVFQDAGAATSAATSSALPAALPDFTGIVAQNGPAVVNITVTSKVGKSPDIAAMPGLDPNDPFSQFFRQFGEAMPQRPLPMHGVGSGFIVSPDGIILTNAHVVDGASSVTVKLTDKREFTAKVIGTDKPSDIAVLKISADDLPVVKIDPADNVRVGEWVVAIGSPFGFANSATSGIVSAKSRTLPGDTYVPFIQTDVPVNPGNSGGPLFNMKGEVIGVNSQIFSRTGGYQGLSFAIPINVAIHVKDQLLSHGSVTRGRLGVTIQDVDQTLADSFGLRKPAGALISAVENNSAAAKAGLATGDVILRYNDTAITNSSQLPVLIADTLPGTTARLEIMRKGETRQISVTVGQLKDTTVASTDAANQQYGRLGVVVRPLDQEERRQAGVSGGLIVEESSGPAADAGIQTGDVILSLNGTPVKNAEQLKQLLAKAGKHVALLVQRNEARIFVPVDLG